MFQTLWRGFGGRVQADLRKLLWPVTLVLLACLLGLVAIGFLTAAAYLAISAAYGPVWAMLKLGAGFMGQAGVALLLSGLNSTKPALAAPVTAPTATSIATPSEASATVAFTAAFVLGRYLAGKKRG